MLTIVNDQAPVPPPAYHRAQKRFGPALHIDALVLVNTLHLLALCRLAVRLAHRRCPPPLPAGPGGAPRIYNEASFVGGFLSLECPLKGEFCTHSVDFEVELERIAAGKRLLEREKRTGALS